jgi:hypothetical protein
VKFLQAFRKTTDGNPVDIQLAQYAPDCDVFITADTRFGWVLDQCRQYKICTMPDVWIVGAGNRGVSQILKRFE